MSDSFSWSEASKKKRAKQAVRLLEARDFEGLSDLVTFHQLHYGKSAAQTSRHTLLAYRNGLRKWLAFMARQPLKRVLRPDADLAAAFLAHLGATLQPGSINSCRSGVNALYRALRWAGATDVQPFQDVPTVRDPVPKWLKREAYSNDDVAALVAAATPVERVAVLLAAHAGFRIHEVAKARWTDVNLTDREIMVTGKGRKTERVNLSGPLVEALQQLPRKGEYILPWRQTDTVRAHLKALCQKADVRYQKRHFHGLRHHAGTRMHRATGDLLLTAKFLRHSSTNSTEIYAKADGRQIAAVLDGWAS